MYQNDTDLLFPARAIPDLAELRSAAWQDLVAGVMSAATDSLEETAFLLMMARLDGCASCNADSYRAMQGCSACARQTIKRQRGSDEDLVALYGETRSEVERHLQKKNRRA